LAGRAWQPQDCRDRDKADRVVSPSFPGNDRQADGVTTNHTPAGSEKAVSRVMPKPASRCPRCRLAFGSTDLMLDHLNARHLSKASSVGHGPAQEVTDGHVVHALESGTVADLERAFRRPSRPRHRRGPVIVAIVALLLLITLVTALLA
jgi:hypothetical protein